VVENAMNKMIQTAARSLAPALALSLNLLAGAPALGADVGAVVVDPQRRGIPLDAESAPPERYKVEVVQGGIERSYKEQPPMIPHAIDKYDISLRLNGCLKCHSEETYEAEKAPKLGDSHYLDRDGNRLPKISMRRYFCTQCHAVQFNPQPLVENSFKGRR
jgi:nitrate reductase (cytochrome), electron transfer subunit